MGPRWSPGSGDAAKERVDSEIEEHVCLVLCGLQPMLTDLTYSMQSLWNSIVTIWPRFTQQANSGAGVSLVSGPVAPVTATRAWLESPKFCFLGRLFAVSHVFLLLPHSSVTTIK